jgi:type IV secretory pathway VirB4 component
MRLSVTRKQSLRSKAFFIDEAWRFFGHPTIRNYIVEALKIWRKKNAAMILSTQSLDELDKSEIVNVVIESCATKIFLANPDMDRELSPKREALRVEIISISLSLK